MEKEVVLQKFIADAGICSRRQAQELIKNGQVKINGQLAKLGDRVSEADRVEVHKKIINWQTEKVYLMFNKPVGYVCTNKRFPDEKNIFDLIDINERLFAVGRLDKNSRGLIILTNDGELDYELTHPSFQHQKKYLVTIGDGPAINPQEIIDKLKRGVDISEGDGIVKAKSIKYLGVNRFEIILTEGKKRQIRRMFGEVNCEVVDLVRVAINNLELGNLATGKYKKLNAQDLQNLTNKINL
jgi:pseudouridine synthase